jgi:UDP-glucose 4-epimerase
MRVLVRGGAGYIGSHTAPGVLDNFTTGYRWAISWRPLVEGDPPVLVAGAGRVGSALGWGPRLRGLEAIVDSAWRWQANGGCSASTFL